MWQILWELEGQEGRAARALKREPGEGREGRRRSWQEGVLDTTRAGPNLQPRTPEAKTAQVLPRFLRGWVAGLELEARFLDLWLQPLAPTVSARIRLRQDQTSQTRTRDSIGISILL